MVEKLMENSSKIELTRELATRLLVVFPGWQEKVVCGVIKNVLAF